MVGARAALVEEDRLAAHARRGLGDDADELVGAHRGRAAAGHQHAVVGDELDRVLIGLEVGPSRALEVVSSRSEFRRVDQDDLEALAALMQHGERLLHVVALELDALAVAGALGERGARRHSERGALDAHGAVDATVDAAERGEAARADVAIGVEDAAAPEPMRQRLDAMSVGALVEVVAGLLRERARELDLEASLAEAERVGLRPPDGAPLGGEALALGVFARGGDDGVEAADARDQTEDGVFAQLHPDGPDLHDRDLAKDVDDEPRKRVALGVDPAIGRRGLAREAQAAAELQRAVEPPRDRSRVELLLGIAADDPDGDRALG